MDEKAIKNFIKQKPCIPATKGVKIASIGSVILFLPMGLLLILVAILWGNNKDIKIYYYALGAVFAICTFVPTILYKHYADRIKSRDNKASTYWLIGTLISFIIGVDAILVSAALFFNERKMTLVGMIIVCAIAAGISFIVAIQWCKRRILYQNGSLELKQPIMHPVLVTPLIMSLVSGASAGGRLAIVVFIISLENAILITGLAQTLLKLKYAKEISAEDCLPKYKL